jgi:hypothetical protein
MNDGLSEYWRSGYEGTSRVLRYVGCEGLPLRSESFGDASEFGV